MLWRVKAPGCKVVLDLRENRPEIVRLYKHVRSLTGRLTIFPRVWARFERRYIQASDVTIVVTQEAEAWYRGRGIAPQRGFWVVPNYAEKRFNPNPQVQSLDGAGVRMLYIGDTGERRGLGVALKAMRGMGPESNVELDVLGDGTYQSEIERMVRDWGLQDRVRLQLGGPLHIRCPFVPGGCGHLSHSRNPHHDTTYANKIFQYVAYGLPILVSDCPSQVQVVNQHDCGAVHRADSPEDFALKLQELVSDPEAYVRRSENGLAAMLKERNWEAAAARLVDAYGSILQ